MSKLPTAEKILSSYSKNYGAIEGNPRAVVKASEALEAMIKFAKIHVKAALKEALENIPCLGSSSDIATYEEVEDAVLNSYPENLIK